MAAVAGVAAAQGATELTTVNETVRVHAVEDATVEGTTDLDPGTNVTIRLQSTGETQPRFLVSEVATVGEDRTFAVEHDFSGNAPGDSFSVTVRTDGSTVAEAEGSVVAADRAVSPTETVVPGFGVATALVAVGLALVAVGRRID
ncbi:BGTF surface domain-containing protein [Halobaculum lipolyticum]|uniref:BGTF surface domain-containing protein n=1 Tax=Halobaculum lipolyticum TaxID=3032001 RepID=A0ABD5WA83_9EURY|nr:BGTF surface domain-containing protein [Halobaculum sp. DT31]